MHERHHIPHESLDIVAHRCGPEDLEPMLDRLETLLHEDYFFRRKHFAAILARPQAAVYAILVAGEFSAIIILYNGSTLTNLYVHPEHRRMGIGQAVLAYFSPTVIRAKGNMSQGNPVPFYQGAGYQATGADPHKPHIVIMEKATIPATSPPAPAPAPPPSPTATQPPAKKEISEAKRAHLDKIRAKSHEKRLAAKRQADYERLVSAGVDQQKALELAYGPAPAQVKPPAPATTPSSSTASPAAASPGAGAPSPVASETPGHWPFSD